MTELPLSTGWDLVIGKRSPGAAGVVEIPLRSGVLEVDPIGSAPTLVLAASDPGLVADLYGDAAAAAVAINAPTILAEPTDRLLELQHLGNLIWLRRGGALPLDPDVLSAEIAVTLTICEPSLDADWQPVPRLIEMAGSFIDAARRLRSGPPLPVGFAGLIGRGLAYIPSAPADPWHDSLQHERELHAAALRWPETADWSHLDDELRRLSTPRAHHLGGDDSTGVDSMDWQRVPRHLLPAEENTIEFRVERDGTGGRVIVDVAAAVSSAPPPVLSDLTVPTSQAIAALFCPPLPIALARGPLQPGPTGWHAEFDLSADGAALINGPLLLDVRDAAITEPPPMGVRRAFAQATRWSARGAALGRLADSGLIGDEVRQHARSAYALAARLWNRLSAAVGASGEGELEAHRAHDRAEQCVRAAASPARLPVQLSAAERWFCHAK